MLLEFFFFARYVKWRDSVLQNGRNQCEKYNDVNSLTIEGEERRKVVFRAEVDVVSFTRKTKRNDETRK